MMKARELGIAVEEKSPQTRAILAKIKKLEKDGYEFEAADASFELLVRRSLEKIPTPFLIESYKVEVVRARPTARETSHATISVRIGKRSKNFRQGRRTRECSGCCIKKSSAPFIPLPSENEVDRL